MVPKYKKASSTLFFLCIGLIFSSCSNNYYDNINLGKGYEYQPGFPELRFAASGLIDDFGDPYILISGDIVKGSLIYSASGEKFQANASLSIRVSNHQTNDVLVNESYEITITDDSGNIVNSQDIEHFEYNYKVPAGNYIVEATITDKNSEKWTYRSTQTVIPNSETNESHITEIQILAKKSKEAQSDFKQATTYDIPLEYDSLKFVFQVTNNFAEPINITSTLIKFRADTAPPRFMNELNYTPSSIGYIGIDFDKRELIESSTRNLNQKGSVIVELPFENLETGNYLIEIHLSKNGENEIFKGRGFSIKPDNYPSLKTPKELAEPLYFLMEKNAYEQLLKINDPDSLKNSIDKFWLTYINNAVIAKQVVSSYYQRVEEANKQFSNFKEGWKTDRGMIYILFGPPWHTNIYNNKLYWSYSHNRTDPDLNFVFERPQLNSKYFPFDHFILTRSSSYFSTQYNQIERWKNGSILYRD
ncbi:MAG: GWxTD domain-containing protein [Gracilimonas sp.]